MSTKPSPTPEYAIKRCDFVTQELWHVTRNEKWICLCNTRDSAVAICNTMNYHERLVKALKRSRSVARDELARLKICGEDDHRTSHRFWLAELERISALLSELEQEEQK